MNRYLLKFGYWAVCLIKHFLLNCSLNCNLTNPAAWVVLHEIPLTKFKCLLIQNFRLGGTKGCTFHDPGTLWPLGNQKGGDTKENYCPQK